MSTQTIDRLQSGTATLQGDPSFADGPWTVHGVAQASEVTQGVSRQRRFWPDETLQEAVDKLVGTPVVMPDDHEQLEASQPPPDIIIGEVVDSAFDEQEGLVFEAEIDDPEIAKRIDRGRVDVSPSMALAEGEVDEERDATRVDKVIRYRDLAVVADGAHASASVGMGPLAEALSRQFDVELEALSVSDPEFNGYDESSWDAPTLSGTFDDDMESARNSATFIRGDGEDFSDLSLFVLNGDAELNVNALDSAWRLASQTDGVSSDDLSRLRSMYEELAVQANEAGAISDNEFDNVWQDRVADSDSMMNTGGDDGPDGSSGQSTPAFGLPTMDDLTDYEQELVAASRQKDDPTVVEAGVPERLAELEEQLDEYESLIDSAEDIDDPTVRESEDIEALESRLDTVESVFAEALQERTGLSDTAIEAMPFEAMAAEFETDEGELDFEALTQEPEAGGRSPDNGGDDGPSDEDIERIEEIDMKLDHVGSALPDSRIEALREEAADLAEVDDYDAALEVL